MTMMTKAASGGVEEGLKYVSSFDKKMALNNDIPLDVAGESPPLSSRTAELTTTASKAGPAGAVTRGPRGVNSIPEDGGRRQWAGKTIRRRGGNTWRGRRK
jgi:hypothetical protein